MELKKPSSNRWPQAKTKPSDNFRTAWYKTVVHNWWPGKTTEAVMVAIQIDRFANNDTGVVASLTVRQTESLSGMTKPTVLKGFRALEEAGFINRSHPTNGKKATIQATLPASETGQNCLPVEVVNGFDHQGSTDFTGAVNAFDQLPNWAVTRYKLSIKKETKKRWLAPPSTRLAPLVGMKIAPRSLPQKITMAPTKLSPSEFALQPTHIHSGRP